jgi:hypothetical protein
VLWAIFCRPDRVGAVAPSERSEIAARKQRCRAEALRYEGVEGGYQK